jgi:hypothetical protein
MAARIFSQLVGSNDAGYGSLYDYSSHKPIYRSAIAAGLSPCSILQTARAVAAIREGQLEDRK